MFDDIPARFWLLLAIAIFAFAPARYVFRHVAHSPSRRDITQPAEDLSWRSPDLFAKCIALLVALAALAIFIFTPAAAAFAQSPQFLPILLLGLGGLALWSVIKGHRSGVIEPLVRGARWEFSRAEQPKRYWSSMAWNALLGGGMLVLGGMQFVEAPQQALRDRCRGWDKPGAASDALAACKQFLAEHPEEDRANVLLSRGSAHYELGDYHRARADYAAAIRLDPGSSAAHFNLGLAHEELGRRDLAADNYAAAIRADPNNADAFKNRGLIFLNSARYDGAVADFTRAHDLEPTKLIHLANRGMAYAHKNDAARAARDFSVVRRTEPSHLIVLHGEAVLAIKRGDLPEARSLLEQALAQQPDDRWAAWRLRKIRQKKTGDEAQAR